LARYEHLPIYKAALDLVVHIEQVVAGFSRYQKYSVGAELRESSRAVLMQVLKANNAQSGKPRGDELTKLREMIDSLLLIMRIAKEVKAFKSFAAYVFAVKQAGSVARQNEGWLKQNMQSSS
jgi:23S rRNA-intervening sequence protein